MILFRFIAVFFFTSGFMLELSHAQETYSFDDFFYAPSELDEKMLARIQSDDGLRESLPLYQPQRTLGGANLEQLETPRTLVCEGVKPQQCYWGFRFELKKHEPNRIISLVAQSRGASDVILGSIGDPSSELFQADYASPKYKSDRGDFYNLPKGVPFLARFFVGDWRAGEYVVLWRFYEGSSSSIFRNEGVNFSINVFDAKDAFFHLMYSSRETSADFKRKNR